ncbi:hypothetical protein [Levilactobacillus brevis]|uniref:hypothetical protein n=1 Tax=Levilactobacillus brevis TaxID=1580 RepID=UPI0035A26787
MNPNYDLEKLFLNKFNMELKGLNANEMEVPLHFKEALYIGLNALVVLQKADKAKVDAFLEQVSMEIPDEMDQLSVSEREVYVQKVKELMS